MISRIEASGSGIHKAVGIAEEIGLSNDKYFQEAYMENMYFL